MIIKLDNFLTKIKVIFFDFDGVILDSMDIREWGYSKIFSNYNPEFVKRLIDFHRENGGISRFYKIRYFYENVLGIDVSEDKVNQLAALFSECVSVKLNDPNRLISDTLSFIKAKNKRYNMHIVSGAEKNELVWLCEQLEILQFFKSVEGSPTPKTELVNDILQNWNYEPEDCILIGDSINDYDAAITNGIEFYGFNNPELMKLGSGYIDSFL